MDTSEPSTNGTSASNLYRLSSLLDDSTYAQKAKETISSFESEILQYPWLFASFMPSVVASHLGVRGVVVSAGLGRKEDDKSSSGVLRIKEFEKSPRGGLGTFIKIDESNSWLRERNTLLKEFGKDGKGRVLICEGGVCREEGLDDQPKQEQEPNQESNQEPQREPKQEEKEGLNVTVLNEALPTDQESEKKAVEAQSSSDKVT